MKKRVIGLDVSKDKLDVSVYDGHRHEHSIIDNDPKKFNEFLKPFTPGSVHIYMEATGAYHTKIAMEAHNQKHIIHVVNPFIIKTFANLTMSRVKTDKADAKIIARFGYNYECGIYEPPSDDRLELIELLRSYSRFIKVKTELTNQIHAYKLGMQVSEVVQESNAYMLESIKKTTKTLEKAIEKFLKSRYTKIYKKLIVIPGVGTLTIATAIAYYDDFSKFDNAKKVVSFAGLNPNPRQSGTSLNGRGSISKKGSPAIRRMLYMAANSARKHNEEFVQYYNHLKSEKKTHKQAIVATANKLLRQLFAIVKYDREWTPYYALQRNRTSNINCS